MANSPPSTLIDGRTNHQSGSDSNLFGDEGVDDFDITFVYGRYETSIHVPQTNLGRVIGTKGATKNRIEVETRTKIFIPRRGCNGDITISGDTRESVTDACKKIQGIVSSEKKVRFTHFVSTRFTDPEIVRNFQKFKDSILSGTPIRGVNEIVFQIPEKIHLTITVMVLKDNEDQTTAAQLLQDCQETVIKPFIEKYGNPKLTLKGVDIMNSNPSSVRTLYGKVESESFLLMYHEIRNYFTNKGFKPDNSKIHVTLMNTKFNKDKKNESFDARSIIEKYGDFFFGEQTLNEIQLNDMGTVGPDGYYESIGIIRF